MTTRRAQTLHFVVQEQILEILLGNPQDDITSRVADIRLQIELSARELTAFVRVDPEELLDTFRLGQSFNIPGRNTPWRSMDVVIILFLHVKLRHTDLLLERALVRRSMADPARPVAIARSLLALAMKLVVNRGMLVRSYTFMGELVSPCLQLLSCYSDSYVITARITRHTDCRCLSTGALKYEQLGTRIAALPRSKTIQQVNVLISALEVIRIDNGNQHMCKVGMVTLKKVLNQLLSDERPSIIQPTF